MTVTEHATARDRHDPATDGGLSRTVARLVIAGLTVALWLHGCHGPDDDHEPVVVPLPREIAP